MFDSKHKELKQTTDYHEARLDNLHAKISNLEQNDINLALANSEELGRLKQQMDSLNVVFTEILQKLDAVQALIPEVRSLSLRTDDLALFGEQIRPCFSFTEIPGEEEQIVDATAPRDRDGNVFATPTYVKRVLGHIEEAMRDGREVSVKLGEKKSQVVVELKSEMLPKKGGK